LALLLFPDSVRIYDTIFPRSELLIKNPHRIGSIILSLHKSFQRLVPLNANVFEDMFRVVLIIDRNFSKIGGMG